MVFKKSLLLLFFVCYIILFYIILSVLINGTGLTCQQNKTMHRSKMNATNKLASVATT